MISIDIKRIQHKKELKQMLQSGLKQSRNQLQYKN